MLRAVVMMLAIAGVTWAAAPPARLTAEQQTLLRERDTLWDAGLEAWQEKREAEGIAAVEKVLWIQTRVNGPWGWVTPVIAGRLGDWHQARGEWGKEAEARRIVVEARRRLHGEDDHRTTDARLALAEAMAQARRTPALREALQQGRTLNRAGVALLGKGQTAKALPLLQEALEIRKEALGEKHPAYATSLNNLALLYREMGDHKAALPLYQKALEIHKQVLGEKHPDYATSLNNLAILYRDTGDARSALPLYEKALKITRQALGEKHPDHAISLSNLASLYRDMGDTRSALPLFRKALEIFRQALGEKHPNYAGSLLHLAMLYKEVLDHRSALPLSRKAVEITRQVLGEKHPHHATSLNGLASLYLEMGDAGSALPLYRKGLEIHKRALGEKHPLYATSLHNLAALYQVMGDAGAALPLFWEALEIRRRALGEKHPSYAQSLHNLAALYHEMNRPGTALVLSEQAMALTRRQLTQDATVQSERQQRQAADALRYRLNSRLSMPEEAAYFSHNHVLGWKGSTFAAQQARRRFLLTEADPATRALALELRDATRTLSLLAPRTDAESGKKTEEVLLRKEALEVRLAQASADFRLAVRPPASEALRAGLPAGAVLLDFLVHVGHDPEKPSKGQEWQRRLVVWVVRSDAPTVRLDLGPMKDVEEALTSWRRAIEKDLIPGKAPTVLRQLVWEPVEKHIQEARTVLVSPDGTLGRLPFAALPGREEGKVLLEEVPLAILPVPQVLEQVLRPVKGDLSMLTLGGVDFGDGGPWVPLPATGPEADAIAKRFRGLFKGEAFALRGAKATKAALAGALAKHRFAHLATHGYFAPESMRSYLDRDDKRKPDLFGREGVSGFDPALLSGLVLAGANRPTLTDDGLLKASEIAEMDLSRVELAVLSACQTGLGKEAAGEGILGLQRAFAVSGCKTVVSSLWSVHDAATAVLMERFYDNLWRKRLGKLEALRQAQLEVMRHPELVEGRAKTMRGTPGLRGAGKAAELVVGGKKERRSPVAWWGAWQLSGDWR